ncbi:MAG: hypothetical protein ACREOO_11805 [bacterium]
MVSALVEDELWGKMALEENTRKAVAVKRLLKLMSDFSLYNRTGLENVLPQSVTQKENWRVSSSLLMKSMALIASIKLMKNSSDRQLQI